MSLDVYSAFRYGHTIDISNRDLDFQEGVDVRRALIPVGSYSLTRLLTVVAQAMNDVGSNDYSLSVDYSTGIITITSSVAFDLLGGTGENVGTSILPLLGFDTVDTLAATSVVGIARSGSIYYPQFLLQSYVPAGQNKKASSATVTKSASGKVSVQSFGEETFMKCDLLFITNIAQPPGSLIKENLTGYEDAIAFLEYLITKAPIEFIEDISKPEEFEIFLLESTPTSTDGVGFDLIETYSKGLPEMFEIKPLTFRLDEVA